MIRRAVTCDLDRVMEIFESAKKFMRSQGNMHQWNGAYPSRDVLEADIAGGNLYVEIHDDNTISGVFAFIQGNDPTYGAIEGEWLNDKSYGTIHRIASDGSVSHFSDRVFDFCFQLIDNVRIDTHQDNQTMIEAIRRNGFKYCGIIYIADGSPRLAYQKCLL